MEYTNHLTFYFVLRVYFMQPCQNIVALPCFLPPSLTLILNQNQQDCSKRRKTFSAQNAQSVGRNKYVFTHVVCG